jgi:hypothetical protein
MPLFQQQPVPASQVQQLRSQGLTDNLIMEELTKQGFKPDQVHQAISQSDVSQPVLPNPSLGPGFSAPQEDPMQSRIEEIAESIIDEKWDELIAEVKKIIAWKESMEHKQHAMELEQKKLKEDFTTLHQGVLGKLDQYDTRMQDVGTELKAVSKVFQDVIPEFVENVKELSSMTKKK